MQRIRTQVAARAPITTAALIAATLITAAPVSADTVVAPVSVQGMLTSQGLNNGVFNAGPGNILVGKQTDYGFIGYRNYFVFDLGAISGTVSSATLTLTNSFRSLISPSPSETWTLYDVADASVPTLQNQYAVSTSAYDDLGTGQTYGSRAFTTADNQAAVSITLDAAAIQDIQTRLGGLFAIGGALTTFDTAETEELFAFSGYDTNTALHLTVGPAAGPVTAPVPNSALAGVALLAPLPLLRRRRAAIA